MPDKAMWDRYENAPPHVRAYFTNPYIRHAVQAAMRIVLDHSHPGEIQAYAIEEEMAKLFTEFDSHLTAEVEYLRKGITELLEVTARPAFQFPVIPQEPKKGPEGVQSEKLEQGKGRKFQTGGA